MARFLLIYYGRPEEMAAMAAASPEEMQEGMKQWLAWAEGCGDALVERGTPLGGGMKVWNSGSAQADRGVMGYSVLEADDMDGALALLDGYPHVDRPGWELEVHECMSLPG